MASCLASAVTCRLYLVGSNQIRQDPVKSLRTYCVDLRHADDVDGADEGRLEGARGVRDYFSVSHPGKCQVRSHFVKVYRGDVASS